MEQLQERWKELYSKTLPRLAKEKDSVQPTWPVHLDHCFGRIVLDNAIGKTQPWTLVLKSPAWKNMSEGQLEDAIALGEDIAVGSVDLVVLDQKSLELRGKTKGGRAGFKSASPKRKSEPSMEGDKETAPRAKRQKTLSSPKQSNTVKAVENEESNHVSDGKDDMVENPITGARFEDGDPEELIANAKMTAFRKRVLSLLCQVPKGRYTTYAALSDGVESTTSQKTCARAVGSAMRNNPFAPIVPCHRVLASGGKIGGFGGEWGEAGKHAQKKRSMLREEGVRFDGHGKVVGGPFVDFK